MASLIGLSFSQYWLYLCEGTSTLSETTELNTESDDGKGDRGEATLKMDVFFFFLSFFFCFF